MSAPMTRQTTHSQQKQARVEKPNRAPLKSAKEVNLHKEDLKDKVGAVFPSGVCVQVHMTSQPAQSPLPHQIAGDMNATERDGAIEVCYPHL
jgi:hypothetical protein